MNTTEHEQFQNLTAEDLLQPEVIEELVKQGRIPALAVSTRKSGPEARRLYLCYIPKQGLGELKCKGANLVNNFDFFELRFAEGTMIERRVVSALAAVAKPSQQSGFLRRVLNELPLPHRQNIIPFPSQSDNQT